MLDDKDIKLKCKYIDDEASIIIEILIMLK